ncbi:hypothetical protein PoB_004675800 [Plakobranchus ocellatus]|uniref:Uncharacterized protein n=1 Tax=Plakobranchus ocellatus TaxID=259542 RepID=A0AAV4BM67_9GAST|nr:hypothetical protein PoB_004675800 [Plakobranchus ocellatus]
MIASYLSRASSWSSWTTGSGLQSLIVRALQIQMYKDFPYIYQTVLSQSPSSGHIQFYPNLLALVTSSSIPISQLWPHPVLSQSPSSGHIQFYPNLIALVTQSPSTGYIQFHPNLLALVTFSSIPIS